MGPIKTRATHEALRHGRYGRWTCDDVEAGRLLANLTGQPWGPLGPTPQHARDTPQRRTAFRQCLQDCRLQVLHDLDLGEGLNLTPAEHASAARPATRRAMETRGESPRELVLKRVTVFGVK